jgi:hypothetical protein
VDECEASLDGRSDFEWKKKERKRESAKTRSSGKDDDNARQRHKWKRYQCGVDDDAVGA